MSKRSIVSNSSGGYKKRRRYVNLNNYSFKRYRTVRPNTTIIPRMVTYDLDLSTNVSKGFGFSNRNLWVNGVVSNAPPGFVEIENLFDLYRIQKVQITILPSSNVNSYAEDIVGGASTAIPYVYHAFDANTGTNPGRAFIQQLGSCRVDSLSKIIKRTIYPRIPINGAAGAPTLVNAGPSAKDIWINTLTDIPAFGFLLYMDYDGAMMPTGKARIDFKIFYECKNVK